MTTPLFRRFPRLLLWIALPCIFWFGFFANPNLVPDTESAHTPVGFIHYDTYRLYYPSLHYYFGELRAGKLPLWDPYRAVGFPSMGSYLFGIFYPLNFPFLFLSVPRALFLTSILHFILAFWSMFRFLRGLRVVSAAAFLGGIAYTFSGFMIFSLWHPSLFNAVATVPLLFAVGDRWVRKGGCHRAAVLGLWIGLQGLAGYLQGTVYALYLLGPFLLLRTGFSWKSGAFWKRWVAGGLVSGLIAVGIMAVSVLPASELSRVSIRKPGGLSLERVHPAGPLELADYATTLLDPRNGFPAPDEPPVEVGKYYYHGFPYVGIAVLFFALLAPLLAGPRRVVLFFGAASVLAVMLALGSNCFAFKLFFHWFPTGDWFRYPRRFLVLATISLATLSALSLNRLWRESAGCQVPGGRLPPLQSILLVGVFLGMAAVLFAPEGLPLSIPLILAACLGALALGRASGRKGQWAAVILLGLLVSVDAFWRNQNPVLHPSADPGPFSALQRGRHFLKENAGLDRIYLQRFGGRLRNHLPSKIGLIDGYQTCLDYEALALERYEQFTNLLSAGTTELPLGFAGNRPILLSEWTYHNSRLFDYMGVKYLAVDRDSHRTDELARLPAKDGNGLLLKLVFMSDAMAIFENPHAIPRARFVPDYLVRQPPTNIGGKGPGAGIMKLPFQDSLTALLDPDLDPTRTVILESPPPPGPWASRAPDDTGEAGRNEVTIRKYEPHRVEIEAVVPRAGFIVLTDQYYPGWKATVNGRPAAALLRGDFLFRAVPVDKGKNLVVLRFSPRSFWTGAWISICSLLACIVLVWTGKCWGRDRTTRKRDPIHHH